MLAPGAGFEPAVGRSTGVCVSSFATLVNDVPIRATPWGITGPLHAVWSTARESNPARRFGRPGPSRSDSGTQSSRSSAPDLHRHVTRLQLAAYLFRSSGANEAIGRRRRESNARDCRRPRFSKPACCHSSTSPIAVSVPTRGLEPPEPAFVALAAIHLPWAWRPLRGLNPRSPIESR